MKTKLFSILFAVILFAGVQSTQAQIRFGAKAGLNLADMSLKVADKNQNDLTDMTVGYHLGVIADISLTDNIFFQPGLMFSTKGNKLEIVQDNKITTSVSWIEVPMNLGYRLELGPAKIGAFVGPYVGMAVGGKRKTKIDLPIIGEQEETSDLKFGDDIDDNLKGLDYGLNIGATAEFGSIFASVQYGLGLANLQPKGDEKNSQKNGVIGISVGYFFN